MELVNQVDELNGTGADTSPYGPQTSREPTVFKLRSFIQNCSFLQLLCSERFLTVLCLLKINVVLHNKTRFGRQLMTIASQLPALLDLLK